MSVRIFAQLDPKENKLPKDMSRTVEAKPMRHLPLVDPDRFVSNNPRIKQQFAQFHSISPEAERAKARERLQSMVDRANKQIEKSIHFKTIRFSVDQAAGRTVAVVKDRKTGKVLKQIPNEQILTMAARLKKNSGLFKDIEA